MKFHIGWLLAASLALSSCATAPEPVRIATPAPVAVAPHVPTACPVCGRVERVEIIQGVRATERGGVVLGGVVGGVLSNPSSNPSSNPAKPAATSARPAAATARTSPPTYRLTLRMADGRHLVIHQNLISPNLHVGSLVRVDNGRVLLLR
jgi:hypothetical protein